MYWNSLIRPETYYLFRTPSEGTRAFKKKVLFYNIIFVFVFFFGKNLFYSKTSSDLCALTLFPVAMFVRLILLNGHISIEVLERRRMIALMNKVSF